MRHIFESYNEAVLLQLSEQLRVFQKQLLQQAGTSTNGASRDWLYSSNEETFTEFSPDCLRPSQAYSCPNPENIVASDGVSVSEPSCANGTHKPNGFHIGGVDGVGGVDCDPVQNTALMSSLEGDGSEETGKSVVRLRSTMSSIGDVFWRVVGPVLGASDSDAVSNSSSSNETRPRSRASYKRRVEEAVFGSKTDGTEHRYKQRKSRRVFADVDSMKANVREALIKNPYNVTDLYHKDGICRDIATSGLFENATLIVIALNALWISYEVDNNDADLLPQARWQFISGENFFCGYFTFEWAMRFGSFKIKTNGLKDRWFVFDSLLVTLMVLETWVTTIVYYLGLLENGVGGTSVMRLFRLVRLCRMARVLRLLRACPELLVMIKAIGIATRAVFFTFCLLLMQTYMFSIVLVQLTENTHPGDTYFTDVLFSMKSLLMAALFPDLLQMVDDLGFVDSMGWLFVMVFMLFIVLSQFTSLNMLVGVLVETVSVVAAVEKESIAVQFFTAECRNIFETIGVDIDTRIEKHMFCEFLMMPRTAGFLTSCGVDVVALVEYSDVIFKGDKTFDFSEITHLMLEFRGSNHCRVKDVVDLRKWMDKEMMILREQLETNAVRQRPPLLPLNGLIRPYGLVRASYSSPPDVVPPKETVETHTFGFSKVVSTKPVEERLPPEDPYCLEGDSLR